MASSSTTDLKSEEPSSNLLVALRMRPMMEDEIHNGATPIAHKVDENVVVIMDPADDLDDILRQNRSREKQYMFDVVLDAKSSQKDIYNKSCKFLMPSIIDGYNATVFAYGATGAGKTYTMLGRDDNPGIMAQALTDLFEKMEQSQERLTFKVSLSYLEIYNEMIRDLLNPNSGYLDLREDHSSGLQVSGLSNHEVMNTLEVMDILKEGNKQRTQEPTAANKTSSRSHAVLIIYVRQRNRLADGIHQQYRMGKLILIDLAGSERAANTQNRGKRMVEGAHINRSLLALGNCINALSDKSGSKYVNYRDSKLTRLLKDALGGNCKTVMVAHISPASFHFEETRNTLTYADRAKNLKTKVRQNVFDMTLHISQYSNVITDLKEEIKRLRQKLEERSVTSNRNLATMQAIQAEVFSHKDEQELVRFKKELQDSYRIQMDFRQSLTELKNNQSEISLELMRQQMLLSSYKRMNNLDLDKNEEILKGLSSMNLSRMTQELAHIKVERSKVATLREGVEHQLKLAIRKTTKIEEELYQLPISGNSHNQKEMINLLTRVHRLELENLRLYEELTRHLEESRARSLVVEFQLRQCSLADKIIERQKEIINSENVHYPADLHNLYQFYKQEMEEINNHRQKFSAISIPGNLNNLVSNLNNLVSNHSKEDIRHNHSRSLEDLSIITTPSTADNYSTSNSNRNHYPKNITGGNNVITNFPIKDLDGHQSTIVQSKIGKTNDILHEVDVSLLVADINMSNMKKKRRPRDDKLDFKRRVRDHPRRAHHLVPLTQSRLAQHNLYLEKMSTPEMTSKSLSITDRTISKHITNMPQGSEISKGGYLTKEKQKYEMRKKSKEKVMNKVGPATHKVSTSGLEMAIRGNSYRR